MGKRTGYHATMPAKTKASPVGRNLSRIRRALRPRMTQADLAAKSGISRATIANLETGFSGNPEYETVRALADALGVKALDLYAGITGAMPVEPLVEALLASPMRAQLAPTDDELAWLRGLGTLDFGGVNPTPESLFFMIMARRAGAAR
jgi:transcriptional regulator with XRE-family HTH domain